MNRVSGYAGLGAFLVALTFSSGAMCIDAARAGAAGKGAIEREYVRSFSIESRYLGTSQTAVQDVSAPSIAQAGLPGILQVLRSTQDRTGFDYLHNTLRADIPIHHTR